MKKKHERESLEMELSALFEKYGIHPQMRSSSRLSPTDFRKIRNIAMQIVQGNINSIEIQKLNDEHKAELGAMVQHIIGLKGKPGLRGIEERNPYYSAFNSPIIRDGVKKGGA